jgi:hypothetical protein
MAFAVAAYITGAYWFTASTSFANPAVSITSSRVERTEYRRCTAKRRGDDLGDTVDFRDAYPADERSVNGRPTNIAKQMNLAAWDGFTHSVCEGAKG